MSKENNKISEEKKVYQTPELAIYGSVQELTQGGQTPGPGDNGVAMNNNKTG